MAFMHDLPIRKIFGIGRVSERVLDAVGLKVVKHYLVLISIAQLTICWQTCGDIYTYRATVALLDKELGLKSLLRSHLGIASNVVAPHAREDTKSIGSERSVPRLIIWFPRAYQHTRIGHFKPFPILTGFSKSSQMWQRI